MRRGRIGRWCRCRGSGLDRDFRFMQTRAETPLVAVDFSKTISCTRYIARIPSYPRRARKSMPADRKSSLEARVLLPGCRSRFTFRRWLSVLILGNFIPVFSRKRDTRCDVIDAAADSNTASALSNVTPNPRQRFVSAFCNETPRRSRARTSATLSLAINTSDFFALRAARTSTVSGCVEHCKSSVRSREFPAAKRHNQFSPQTKLRRPRRLILDPQVSSRRGCKPENVAAKQRRRHPLYNALWL
ncbi:Uncharacterized protein DBV15_05761 [Temnothorax longispinosus]|uniref:Uncharacterized protein n=1 Tax=Temnothorax longispinosus TaxID=300112 RepID=A0A4S2KFS3_9HYME|nr:Uncharacterized protein DBV15_05761 [Temnothorax longispinosus]